MPASVIDAFPRGRAGRLAVRLGPRTSAQRGHAERSSATRPGRGEHVRPHLRQVARRHDRVGRQSVDLGLVEEEEERAEAADAVLGVAAVELRAVPALGLELREPRVGALPQLLERPELDRLRRARLRARRLVAALEPVVAERALPDAAVLLRERRQVGRPRSRGAACRGRRTGRPGRSSRSRCRCPAARRRCRTRCGRGSRSGRRRGRRRGCSACRRPTPSASGACPSPRVRAAAVAVQHAAASRCSMNATWRQVLAPSSRVLSYDSPVQTWPSSGIEVPLLARDLARLAADADRGVGEEADALLLLVAVRLPAVGRRARRAPAVTSSPRFSGLDPRVLLAPRVRLLAQLGDEARQLGAARPAAGPDPARERLDLLDVDVRVERHVREVVRRVAGDRARARPSGTAARPGGRCGRPSSAAAASAR